MGAPNTANALRPPFWMDGGTWTYLLGTDKLGRDLLSVLIVGARTSLIVCVVGVLFAGVIGIALGLTGRLLRQVGRQCDHAGGRCDHVDPRHPLHAAACRRAWSRHQDHHHLDGAAYVVRLHPRHAWRGTEHQGAGVRRHGEGHGGEPPADTRAPHPAQRRQHGDRHGEPAGRRRHHDGGRLVVPGPGRTAPVHHLGPHHRREQVGHDDGVVGAGIRRPAADHGHLGVQRPRRLAARRTRSQDEAAGDCGGPRAGPRTITRFSRSTICVPTSSLPGA